MMPEAFCFFIHEPHPFSFHFHAAADHFSCPQIFISGHFKKNRLQTSVVNLSSLIQQTLFRQDFIDPANKAFKARRTIYIRHGAGHGYRRRLGKRRSILCAVPGKQPALIFSPSPFPIPSPDTAAYRAGIFSFRPGALQYGIHRKARGDRHAIYHTGTL